MANNNNGNQFRDDEIIILEQLRDGKVVKNIYPKIGDGSGSLMRRTTSRPWPPRSTTDRSASQGRRLTDSKPEKMAIRQILSDQHSGNACPW